jgi:hypothetical protein
MDADINGLFEIHVSVDPAQVFLLRTYCEEREQIKPILACSLKGSHPNQLMISKWFKGSRIGAVFLSKEVYEDMRKYGLRVERVKVEAMLSSDGVPAEPWAGSSDTYFEFHFKVDSAATAAAVAAFAAEHGLAVSFSAFKPEVRFLLTLRMPSACGSIAALKKCEEISKLITGAGMGLGKVQREYSVFDTCPEYDEGWIA